MGVYISRFEVRNMGLGSSFPRGPMPRLQRRSRRLWRDMVEVSRSGAARRTIICRYVRQSTARIARTAMNIVICRTFSRAVLLLVIARGRWVIDCYDKYRPCIARIGCSVLGGFRPSPGHCGQCCCGFSLLSIASSRRSTSARRVKASCKVGIESRPVGSLENSKRMASRKSSFSSKICFALAVPTTRLLRTGFRISKATNSAASKKEASWNLGCSHHPTCVM